VLSGAFVCVLQHTGVAFLNLAELFSPVEQKVAFLLGLGLPIFIIPVDPQGSVLRRIFLVFYFVAFHSLMPGI